MDLFGSSLDVRVGPEVVMDPAFLVSRYAIFPSVFLLNSFWSHLFSLFCRTMEDFVTWVNTSAIKKQVHDYNDMVSDWEFSPLPFLRSRFLKISQLFSARRLRYIMKKHGQEFASGPIEDRLSHIFFHHHVNFCGWLIDWVTDFFWEFSAWFPWKKVSRRIRVSAVYFVSHFARLIFLGWKKKWKKKILNVSWFRRIRSRK